MANRLRKAETQKCGAMRLIRRRVVKEQSMKMNGKRSAPLVMLAAAMLMCVCAANGQEYPVVTKTLKNGMKILVQTDHSIPNVAMYTFYKVGSRNERPGTTGISHFFEHMMFNGAKKYGPGELDKAMEANGGSNNAYTSRNVTVYQDWFPETTLPLIFDIEADRIENLSFDPKKIESERGVVESERRSSVDAENEGVLDEQLWATAFIAHPYQWPVVGWMSDIEHWTIADLKHHFEMGYSPSNATMVVVGGEIPGADTGARAASTGDDGGTGATGGAAAGGTQAGGAAAGDDGLPRAADGQPGFLRVKCAAIDPLPGGELADVPASGG
jgi:zinc protease